MAIGPRPCTREDRFSQRAGADWKGIVAEHRRYCLALDLKDDPALIEEYRRYHAPGQDWPEITESIKRAGITDMEIYLIGNRLFLMMEVNADFSFAAKLAADAENPKVGEWEALMWRFQEPLKWAKPGEKWVLTELIYKLP